MDAELVRRKIARSREHAVEMIKDGRVVVGGFPSKKPSTVVEPESSIKVEDSDDDGWASRGAHKLLGALAAFEPLGLSVAGKKALDAGASTGGFTDVLLRRGASEVVAVDVDERLLDENGKLCLGKAKLIVYSHGDYLALGRKLGSFGYSVRKKKRK